MPFSIHSTCVAWRRHFGYRELVRASGVAQAAALALISGLMAGCGGGGTITPQAAQSTPSPSIMTQPASQTITAGQTALFSVTATGTAPLSYQWRRDGSAIAGASGSNYTTPAATAADNGASFDVLVSNAGGTTDSGVATLTVNSAPVITQQPANQTVTIGQTATFSITATGNPALSYQWQKNGVNITGATAGTYTTPATTAADKGSTFDVVVTNILGSITSNVATLQAVAGAAATMQVETAPDGSGIALGPLALTAGNAVVGYAITRDSGGNFVANAPANWSFSNITGGVVGSDLAVSTDTKSATFTAHKVGTAQLRAASSTLTPITSGTLTANPAAASALVVAGYPSNATASTAGSFIVTAVDPFGNIVTGFADLVRFAASDPQAILPSNSALTRGVGAFSATFQSAGTQSLSATDSSNASISGSESGITVVGATATNAFPTTVTFSASNQPVALSASVTSSAGMVSQGTVTFAVLDGSGHQIGASVTSGPVTASSASATFTLPGGTAVGTYSITAAYSGSTLFSASTDSPHTLTVANASATVVLGGLTATYDGTPKAATATTTPVGLAVTFNYTATGGTAYGPTATPPTTAGNYSVTASVNDPNYQGSATGTLLIGKASPNLTWPAPAAITYGAALSSAQLDATTSVQGTFAYSPAVGAVLAAGSQTLSATFTPTDTTDYATATASATLTVNKAAPVISWATPAPITYGVVLGSAQLNAASNVPGSFVYSPAAGASLPAGTQPLTATFTPTDAADYTSATANVTLTVTKAAPVVTWPVPSPITYGTALGATQLDATASVPGSFSYAPAAGAVLGAGSQTLAATFAPTDATDYSTANATVTLTVGKGSPIVSWSSPAGITYGTALSNAQLNASANVPGSFTYAPPVGTVLGAGTQTLTATFTPADSSDYSTAAANVALNVTKATPSITWPAPAAITYGTALGASQLDATASVPGTFAYAPAAGIVPLAGTQTLTVAFTPADVADYTGAIATASLTVNKATPTITWNAPSPITYGTALSGAQLNATANVPGSFAYSPAAGSVLGAGSQTLTVTFTPADTTDYATPTANATLMVNKAAPAITWSAPAAITYGTALSSVQLDAAANVPGTFAYTPASETILGGGSHSLTVTFTPTDAADYTSATASNSLTVIKATPQISWASPATITYGTALSGAQLNATANVSGSFAYSPAAGTVLGAGNQTLTVTFTPADAIDYANATANVSLAINKATPTISWTAPLAITYGTALSGAQLDATASVPGSFAYTPAAGAVLGAGSQTLTATFTPTDSADYTTATASVDLSVGKAAATVTLGSPNVTYSGTAQTATATTNPPGLAVTFSYSQNGTAVTAPTTAGTYSVTATVNDSDYQGSATGTLIIGKATPAITWPTPAAISFGTALNGAQLDATANVPGSFSYSPVAGTVLSNGTQTLSVTFTPADGADYTAAAASVSLIVKYPPSVNQEPVSQTVDLGDTATFTMAAVGAAPLAYQWRLNGMPISGATSTSYTTLAATPQENGAQYDVVVTNGDGTQTSSVATLTVNVPPSIASQPVNQSVLLGQTATFSVTAIGAAPLQYQWQRDGVTIAGATSPTYTTPSTTILDDGALFTVVVTNSIDSVTSSAAMLSVNLATAVDVVTYHNDNSRTGQNLSETILSPSNVNSASFGLTAFLPLDGQVDAQPLYLSNVAIPNQGTYNVLYAATENDSVYAFDATTGNVLWQTSVLGPGEAPSDDRGCSEITPEIGVTATPVIDRTRGPNGAIYVVAMSTDGSGNYFQRLHALDVATGAELFGGPTTIAATFPGAGDGTNGASVVFDPAQYKERAGLLLSNGVIYTAWASNCNARPYTGWVIALDENTLQVTNALNLTPNGTGGAITMGGGGLAADSAGNIYLLNGRGTFDSTLNSSGFPAQNDFGNSFLKLSTSSGLAVADYFAPSTTIQESAQNMDLGAGGVLLLPDLTDSQGQTHQLAVGAGQDTNIYLAGRNSMGEFHSASDQIYQELDGALAGGTFTAPAYYNNTLYFGPSGGAMEAFAINNAQLAGAPASQTTGTLAAPGSSPAISANGGASAIVWAVEYDQAAAILHAYDATNLANELYNSTQASSGRDSFGGVSQYVTATIANANVFVGTTNGIAVFGLLPSGPANTAPSIISGPADQMVSPGQTATFTVAATGSAPLGYQWQQNGVNIPGATSSSYTTQPATVADDRTIYSVTVSNAYGSDGSAALLEVNAAPQIAAPPVSQSITTGQTATFTVTVVSPYPVSYKWQQNGIDIPGANLPTYTTPAAALADNGEQFTVVVSNDVGSATSEPASLLVTPPPVTASYYVDFYGGSDGNNGASEATPWQHAPGMNGCTANCAIAALHPGDQVIFKGGVAWDSSAFPMTATWSGTNVSPIYYGVDQTWFLGAAWARPIFDLDGPVWSAPPVLANSASNIVFDNLEIENERVSDAGAATPLGGITVAGGSNVVVQNCYLHGWSVANPGPGSDSTPFGGVVFYNGAVGGVVRNCTFDGSPSSDSGTGVYDAQIVQNNVFEQMPNAVSVSDPAADVSANQIFNLTDSVDLLAKKNGILVSGGGKIYNNIVHDLPAGGAALYLDSFQSGAGNTQEIYNNLIWNAGSAPAVVIDPGVSLGNSASSQVVYNNTIAGGGAGCVRTVSGPLNLTNLAIENNFCVSDQTSTPAWCWNAASGNALCGTLWGVTSSNNVVIGTQAASTQGYAVANGFQPVSATGATVGTGLNLSASCASAGAALCSDRLGLARPSGSVAWDAGAYQYQAAAANSAPTFVVQPASTAATAGGTVTFSVVALGSAPLSYQWQADGVAIDGATASSFTTDTLSGTDDGTQFSVIVSNALATVTSSVALLTVSTAPGQLNADVSQLNFGNVYLGASNTLSVALTNTGSSNVDISNVSLAGAGFSASGIPAGLILEPGGSAGLNISFSPASSGPSTGSITIVSDSANSPLSISLNGSGAALTTHAALLSWSPSPSSVLGYNVYRGTIAGGPYALINTTPIAETAYADVADPAFGPAETIFTLQTPATTGITDGPGVEYELGTVFQAAVPGQITAVRFWKDASDNGTHVGNIWSATGQLLASVTFTNETASGWQQQTLAAPLSIAAGFTYVVSVNTASSYYVATDNGLAATVTSGYLSTTVGNNGVYGPLGQFPTNSFESTNYFRDVVFVPGAGSVQPGQTYFYVVTCVSSEGIESGPSNQVSASIPSP